MHHSLILLLLLAHSFYASAQKDWVLAKEEDGISVYHYYAEARDLPELKITFTVQSSMAGAVQVINDANRFSEWVYACEESKILEQLSPQHYIYYNRSDFPLWFDDREFLLEATTEQDPNTLKVYCKAWSRPNYLPLDPDRIRVRDAYSLWVLEPQPHGNVSITYTLFADPIGSIPAWLTRAAINLGPVQSIKIFIERVESKKYRMLRLPHIVEPSPSASR